MKLPDRSPLPIGHERAAVLLVLVTVLLVGCSTKPSSESSGIVATPIGPTTEAEADSPGDSTKKKEENPSTQPQELAEKTEPPPVENATELAADAKAKMQWSSSESTLREAFELSGRAARLAPKDAAVALQHAECAVRYAQATQGIDRPAKICKEAMPSMDSAGLSGTSLDAKAAYYRGSLTGLIMQSQGLAAAGKIPELEALFKQSASVPGIEQGGPLRALGMLYLKAPPWPTGIGDIGLAIENLEKASQNYPGFPYNHVCLARAYAEDGMGTEATSSLAKAEELLSSGKWGALGQLWLREIAEIRKSIG